MTAKPHYLKPKDFKYYMDDFIDAINELEDRNKLIYVAKQHINDTLLNSILSYKDKVIQLQNIHKAFNEVEENYEECN